MIQLISRESLNEITQFSQYVEDDYVEQLVTDCQIAYVKPLLCNDLFAELLTQKEGTTLTPENELLLYGNDSTFFGVTRYLAWLCFAQWLRMGNSKPTQTGLQKLTSQYSEQAPDTEKQDKINFAESRADFFRKEVIQFLNDNKADYPTWCAESDCNDNTQATFNISSVRGVWRRGYRY
jgi:hypothetical protein